MEHTSCDASERQPEKSKDDKRLMTNAEIVRTMPDNIAAALAKARTKPVWCSDVRWRMELGRRKYKYLY